MLDDNRLSKVLYIDLTKKSYWVRDRIDLFSKYIGGTGVGIKLLQEECPKETDPLGKDNPIIFAVGPLTGLFPLASKTVAMFKSPHTGNLGESHSGGRSAIAIKMAGYGAIVIKGKSDIPVYLAIHGDHVYFRDASALWGMKSCFTVGRIIRENEPGAGLRTIMRIGKAGENLVSYASVTTETFRHFGRLGLGAVFGSKKLKGIIISGKRSIKVQDKKTYKELYSEIYKAAVDSPLMKKYHDLGTPENILKLNEMGGLPTRNLQKGHFEFAENISGENFAEHYLGRRLACFHCPVGCIHLAALREPYEDEPYFYKTSMISYDYEPIFALATMLGISEPEGFLKLMDSVEKYCIDAMSTGVVLAWATEAQEKGIITEKETNGLNLKWGDYKTYIQALSFIVEQPNTFYKALSKGVEHASSIYGGKEFAMAFGGNEMPGYHTGPGAHLGFLTGARHSHLDSAGYSIDEKILPKTSLSAEELGRRLLEEERWRQILSSLVICFFARGIYSPQITTNALKIAGFSFSEEDLKETGKVIHAEKYRFKEQEGFSLKNIRIPQRIFQTPSAVGNIEKAYIERALNYINSEISSAI